MESAPNVVFIIDDDADLRVALARLLDAAGYEPRPCASAETFLTDYDPAAEGCILLDLEMRGMHGLEVQAALNALGCRRPIIFLTGCGSIPLAVAAVRAGAVNVLTRPIDPDVLLAAIAEAMRIEGAARELDQLNDFAKQRLVRLTPRERQVLEHVLVGKLNKQIAGDLGTTEKTIKVHRSRVMRKMGARTFVELMHLSTSAGVQVEHTRHLPPPAAWGPRPN